MRWEAYDWELTKVSSFFIVVITTKKLKNFIKKVVKSVDKAQIFVYNKYINK